MPKRLFCCLLMLCTAFLCSAAHAEMMPEDAGYYPFTTEMPQALWDAFDGDAWLGYAPVSGQYCTRGGVNTHAHVVMAKDGQYVLCGLDFYDGAWVLTAYGHSALYQDRPPQLALGDGYNYGYSFDVRYDDPETNRTEVFTYFSGSDTWRLQGYAVLESGQPVMNVSIAPRVLYFDSRPLLHEQPITLEAFDIEAFPRDYETAVALSNATAEAQADTALIRVSDEDWSSAASAALRKSGASSAGVLAHYFQGVEVELIGAADGDWVQVRIGDMEGFMPRSNLAVGSQKAAVYPTDGIPGVIDVPMPESDLPLYAGQSTASQVLASIPLFTYVSVMGYTDDLQWVHVRYLPDENGPWLTGYMDAKGVTQTDNMRDAVIDNPNPSDRLNLRKGPGKSYESLGKYYNGLDVVFLHTTPNEAGWRHVVIEGVTGYMQSEYLNYSSAGWSTPYMAPLGTVQGAPDGLPLRTAPSSSAEIKGTYDNGAQVEILGVVDQWAHVRAMDGLCGYMPLRSLGGEPKSAASAWAVVTRETPLYYAKDQEQPSDVTLRVGDRMKVTRRPYTRWELVWADEIGGPTTPVLNENDPWVYVTDDERGGYVRWECLKME